MLCHLLPDAGETEDVIVLLLLVRFVHVQMKDQDADCMHMV